LSGDSSDNISPARKGIGPKTAINLVMAGIDPTMERFGDMPDEVQRSCEKVREGWADFRRNIRLMRLPHDPKNAQLSLKQQIIVKKFIAEVCYSQPLRLFSYREFIEKLCELELAEALSFRVELWQLSNL